MYRIPLLVFLGCILVPAGELDLSVRPAHRALIAHLVCNIAHTNRHQLFASMTSVALAWHVVH
jgi:hypothetical protein